MRPPGTCGAPYASAAGVADVTSSVPAAPAQGEGGWFGVSVRLSTPLFVLADPRQGDRGPIHRPAESSTFCPGLWSGKLNRPFSLQGCSSVSLSVQGRRFSSPVSPTRWRQVASGGRCCRAALNAFPPADSLVLLAPGRPTADGGAYSASCLSAVQLPMTAVRRSDQQVPAMTLPTSPPRTARRALVADPAVGTMVGAAAAGWRRPTRCRSTTAVEITGRSGCDCKYAVPMTKSSERVALLVIADGSACHGDDAPGRRDDRAAAFDAAVAAALAAGDPAALVRGVRRKRELAPELLASVGPAGRAGPAGRDRPTGSGRTALLRRAARGRVSGRSWRWTDR